MTVIEYIIAIWGCLYLIGKAMDLCTDKILKSQEQISKKLDLIERKMTDKEDNVFIPDHPMFVDKE